MDEWGRLRCAGVDLGALGHEQLDPPPGPELAAGRWARADYSALPDLFRAFVPDPADLTVGASDRPLGGRQLHPLDSRRLADGGRDDRRQSGPLDEWLVDDRDLGLGAAARGVGGG